MFLLIDKNKNVVHTFVSLEEIVGYLGDIEAYDIHHQLKGTGRWDSQDRQWVVIVDLPDEE